MGSATAPGIGSSAEAGSSTGGGSIMSAGGGVDAGLSMGAGAGMSAGAGAGASSGRGPSSRGASSSISAGSGTGAGAGAAASRGLGGLGRGPSSAGGHGAAMDGLPSAAGLDSDMGAGSGERRGSLGGSSVATLDATLGDGAPSLGVSLSAAAGLGLGGAFGLGQHSSLGHAEPQRLGGQAWASSKELPPNQPPPQVRELELRVQELERTNTELERRLDVDGLKFLEAISSCEKEIEQLNQQNKQLVAERAATEELLRRQGDDGELRATNLRMERECQDMLQQLDEFEREKDEELRVVREDVARLTQRLADQEQHYSRLLAQAERDRETLLQAMTDEGQELQSRIEKLSRDKEALSMDLAKALARADMAAANSDGFHGAGAGGQNSLGLNEARGQLRAVVGEREALKDEVTNKEGELVLLRSRIETTDRKLRLTDMENAMLKSELEVLRSGMGKGSALR